MKQAGDMVRLSVRFWDGPAPEPGDLLETHTGRLYIIETVRIRSGKVRALTCIVAPRATTTGRIFRWDWARRERARS